MAKQSAPRPRAASAAPSPGRGRLALLGALVVVAVLVAGVVALVSSGGKGGGGGGGLVVEVQPQAAYGLVQEHAAHPDLFQVIDVRTPAEYAGAHLVGATNLDVNAGDFRSQVSALPRGRTYLVYCHSGNRSARATAVMKDLGFTRVYDLQGGITAWAQAGLPVVTG